MPSFQLSPIAVAWLPWGADAFARAQAEVKPVLLSITTTWSRACQEMDRTSYADPSITTVINERFVPVRVDGDERPDISERYSLGGWPTTLFLLPDGAILGGGTFVASDRMPGVLRQVLDLFGARGDRVSPPRRPSHQDGAVVTADELREAVFAGFDAEHGGFGIEPKFPLAAPLRLALDLSVETRDLRFETMVMTSLDGMGWSGIYDEVDGGFFRYATTADWRLPETEKLLDANAALLRLYLDAGVTLGIARFTERAADILRYLQTWLADPVDGGWAGSQEASVAYYAADTPAARRIAAPPRVSRLFFADGNAAMASAALHAARDLDDAELTAFALKSLERILLGCYKPGAGVAHGFDGRQARIRGLLADQLTMAGAVLDAFDVTGNIVYEMMAEELTQYAVRLMWDEEGGGFFDRAEDDEPGVGLMRQRIKPFAVNCDAVRTLRRLAAISDKPEFTTLADRTLAAMAPHALAHGPLGAHYLLALRDAPLR